VHDPLSTNQLSPSEAALQKLLTEKERRSQEREQNGETYWLQLTANAGEDTTALKGEILAEHLKKCPQDRGRLVQWIERIFIDPPRRALLKRSGAGLSPIRKR
jgi:hypothetical protein